MIWSNDAYKARNLYIFMGHHPNLFQNTAYVSLLRNAIHLAGNEAVGRTTAARSKRPCTRSACSLVVEVA